TKTMENFTKIARWYENPIARPGDLAKKGEYEKAVAKVKTAIKVLTARADAQVRDAAKKDEKLPGNLESKYPDATKAELKKLSDELAALQKNAPDVPNAMGVSEAKTTDVALLRRGNLLTPGKLAPRRFPVVLAGESQDALPPRESGRRELAAWLTKPD